MSLSNLLGLSASSSVTYPDYGNYDYSNDKFDTGYDKHHGSVSSGYDHSAGGYSGHGDECCPLVVDPVTVTALLSAIAASAVFLARVITIELTGRRRRRRSLSSIDSGKINCPIVLI